MKFSYLSLMPISTILLMQALDIGYAKGIAYSQEPEASISSQSSPEDPVQDIMREALNHLKNKPPYEILGVEPNATKQEIEDAFNTRTLSLDTLMQAQPWPEAIELRNLYGKAREELLSLQKSKMES